MKFELVRLAALAIHFYSTLAFPALVNVCVRASPRFGIFRLSQGGVIGPLRYKSGSEDEEVGSDGAPSDESFFASLRARRDQLKSRSGEIRNRWVGAKCHSSSRLSLDDWVRRLDLRRWPIAALGTARGSVRVVDLDRSEVLAQTSDGIHSPIGGNPNGNQFLFGDFDGGGTMAVAMKGDSVISAGREGGAKAWRFDRVEKELVPIGEVSSLGRSIVTSLAIDDEQRLWAATFCMYEGTVFRFDLLEKTPLSEQDPLKIKTATGILSLAVNDEVGLAVVGTAGGTVELISAEDGSIIGTWDVFNGTATSVRSVEVFHAGILDEDEAKNNKWCVVCGGGDGSIHVRWLNTKEGIIVPEAPFDEARRANSLPPHSGMVVSLTACKKNGAGMLVSGAQDGTLRVWDFSDDPLNEGDEFSSEYDAGVDPDFQPLVLYQLVGYKVWLGSICVDEEGLRLVSDGSDNSVVVHDFSSDAGE